MRVKDRFWDKKKWKACKSKGFCKENEEDVWRGKSSIEKVTGRDEKLMRSYKLCHSFVFIGFKTCYMKKKSS